MVNYVLKSLNSGCKISPYLQSIRIMVCTVNSRMLIDNPESSSNGVTVAESHFLLVVLMIDKKSYTESFCALVSSSDETKRSLELSEVDGPDPSIPDFIPTSSAASFLP